MKKRCLFFLVAACLFSAAAKAQTVSTTGSLHDARWYHCSQVLSNGKVLVFGGDNGDFLNEVVLASSELYDPAAQTWGYSGSMHTGRTNFASTLLNNGNVLAIGGSDQNANDLSSVELYNVASGTWQNAASMITPRINMAAVKLLDGRVLVAGYGKKAELYDPETNTWTATGDMNLDHGEGMATIVLDNGQVLATGGDNAPTKAELYNPVSGLWTLLGTGPYRNHYFHKMIRISNGIYLLTGTQSLATADQLDAEYYFSSTKSFSTLPGLLTNVGITPLVLMDDGKVVTYGLGDIFNPSNVKSIQIFNSNTLGWAGAPYNYIGANAATGHKLQDGTVLLIGGSSTTGNGASTTCLLINSSSFSSCVTPDRSLAVTGNTTCNGYATTVSLPSTESGVSYQASISGSAIGAAVAGGSAVSIALPDSVLITGKNVVNIIATKSGCPAYYLTDTAQVSVASAGMAKPIITAGGPTSLCSGSSVTLTAPAGMSTYQWSNGATTQSITVSAAGGYRVRVQASAGACFSAYADPTPVSIISNTVSAGSSETICANRAAYALTGYSPAGGTWSGTGVNASGVFDPSVSGAGTFNVSYSICGHYSSKSIVVNPVPKINVYTLTPNSDSVCNFGNTTVVLNNTTYGAVYKFMKGTTVLSTVTAGTNTYINFSTGTIGGATQYSVQGVYYSGCGNDTLIKTVTINLFADPTLTVGTKTPNVCKGSAGSVYIVKSSSTVVYQLMIGSYNIGAPTKGNKDTLFISTGNFQMNTNAVIKVNATEHGCNNSLTQKANMSVTGPSAYFTVPNYNPEAGENIPLLNTSINPGGGYQWNFGVGASTATSTDQNPADISYSTPGIAKIRLICTSASNCRDTLVQKISVINPVSPATCDYSIAVSNNPSEFIPIGVAYDNKNNSFLFTQFGGNKIYEYGNYGDSIFSNFKNDPNYTNIYAVTKYNAKGQVQWIVPIRHNSNWSRVGDIITDSLGNVYCSYFHGDYLDSIRLYSTNGQYITFDPPTNGSSYQSMVIIKYDKNGILQWYNTYLEMYTCDKVTLALDKNLNLYVASNQNLYAYDKNGAYRWKSTYGYADMEVNSQGNLVALRPAGLIVDQYDLNGTLLSSTPNLTPTSAGTIIGKYLKLDNNDNIYLAGQFYGDFVFKGTTLSDPYLGGGTHNDEFICKLSTTGAQQWIKRIKVNNFVWIKGFDLKDDKILLLSGGSNGTSINYNQSGSTFLDTIQLSASNLEFYLLASDTSEGPVKLKIIGDVSFDFNLPYSDLAFSKVSNTFSFAIPTPVTNTLGQQLTPITIDAYQRSAVLIRGTLDCIFPTLAPVSEFTINGVKCKNTTIQFLDLSDNAPDSWTWDFPGGTPSSSTQKNPTVTYASAGSYSATLTTSNENGSGGNYSTTFSIEDNPVLIISPDQVCYGNNITLNATGASSYTWENSSTGTSFSISTITKDTTITVVGKSSAGCSTSVNQLIKMNGLPSISFDLTFPSTVCASIATIDLPAVTPAGGTFSGSGITGTKFYPATAGTGPQTITYSYTDANNCTNTGTLSISVADPPTLSIQSSLPAALCANDLPILLNAIVPAGGTYSGTGVSNGTFDPSAALTGSNVIVYSYTDNNGCSTDENISIEVSVCTETKNEMNGEKLSIFPNPSQGRITLKSSALEGESASLLIVNGEGKTVVKEQVSYLHDKEFDLSPFGKGIYYVQIVSGSGVKVNKAVVVY